MRPLNVVDVIFSAQLLNSKITTDIDCDVFTVDSHTMQKPIFCQHISRIRLFYHSIVM